MSFRKICLVLGLGIFLAGCLTGLVKPEKGNEDKLDDTKMYVPELGDEKKEEHASKPVGQSEAIRKP